MKGRPNVAENGDGSWWVDELGSEAGKSGSRTKIEDGVEWRGRDWRTAIGWGTVRRSSKAGGGDLADTGRGKQSSVL